MMGASLGVFILYFYKVHKGHLKMENQTIIEDLTLDNVGTLTETQVSEIANTIEKGTGERETFAVDENFRDSI